MEILSKIIIALVLSASVMINAKAQTSLEKAFEESYLQEKNGNYSQAVIALSKFYNKGSYDINLRLGWLNYLAGQYTESVTYYNKCIALKPLSIEALFGLTYPASAMGNWEQVITAYKSVLKIDPNNYTANLKLGQIYLNRTEYAIAESYFQLVLNQYPFTYDVVLNAAWNYYYLGKFREAEILFNKVLLLNPGDTSATEALSKIK